MTEQPQIHKPFSPWPMIGVISVLLPVLIFAYLGWRAENLEQSSAQRGLAEADAQEVAVIFYEGLADGRHDVAAAALARGAKGVDLAEPGFEGLTDVRVMRSEGSAPGVTSGEATTSVLVEYTTTRPWHDGRVPGTYRQRVDIEQRNGEWRITRLEAPMP
ncbi:MAG TPA: hypothetical protein VLA05_11465 [Coriobacteriia bacterium]|nr:hypothetical protein [Coriobacteriia bacterium]